MKGIVVIPDCLDVDGSDDRSNSVGISTVIPRLARAVARRFETLLHRRRREQTVTGFRHAQVAAPCAQ